MLTYHKHCLPLGGLFHQFQSLQDISVDLPQTLSASGGSVPPVFISPVGDCPLSLMCRVVLRDRVVDGTGVVVSVDGNAEPIQEERMKCFI